MNGDLPPSSSESFLPVPAVALRMMRPTSVEPVNATLSTSSCSTIAAPVRAVAGDDVDDARRQAGLDADFGEGERGERREFGGLQHHRIAAGERRRDLPGEHQQRKVPRDDLTADAHRLGAGKLAGDQRGPARMVVEVARDERNVGVARLADRLAVVDRLQHRQEALALLDQPRQRVKRAGARIAGERAPAFKRPTRGGDGGVDVLRRPLRDACDFCAARRLENVEQLGGLGELSVNEMAEAGLVAISARREPHRRLPARGRSPWFPSIRRSAAIGYPIAWR